MHDRNGTELKVGDIVSVPCVIRSLNDGSETFCNVELETQYGRRPDGETNRFSAVNTGQVVLLQRPHGT
jgi:hypothetical protein